MLPPPSPILCPLSTPPPSNLQLPSQMFNRILYFKPSIMHLHHLARWFGLTRPEKPAQQASLNKRFASQEEYNVYGSRTSPLIPLPPALYGSLPVWIKVAFLLELPMYSSPSALNEGMLK
ncbi:hypothetical protein KSP40_PGU018768 [Platanthera guangdongensis]|uniref:Uncharacterized protein n=1 Tax=Platanthera guangdongensis TaxID=2320717 RepID=A0ABR2LJN5_9ASPA